MGGDVDDDVDGDDDGGVDGADDDKRGCSMNMNNIVHLEMERMCIVYQMLYFAPSRHQIISCRCNCALVSDDLMVVMVRTRRLWPSSYLHQTKC